MNQSIFHVTDSTLMDIVEQREKPTRHSCQFEKKHRWTDT